MRSGLLCLVSAVLLLGGWSAIETTFAAAAEPASAAAAPDKDAVFTQEQLDQMLAPVALYPDPLLAQVLMAATYPGEVAEAAAWVKAHPQAKGDDAVRQVADQPWDPSVQALVAFPQVLATLEQDSVWVQRLGDAFLAQPDEVMGSVQRLRHQAQAAGNLKSNNYQTVTAQTGPAPTPTTPTPAASTIVIQPADPQVVYVPSYNPTVVYGSWSYPASPPVYYPPPPAWYPGSALMAGLAFGTGVAVVASLWGDCDWGSNDVDINVSRYNNINRNNQLSANQNKWEHNAVHRDGVPYRDTQSRERYGRQRDGARQRDAYRGDDPARAQAREQARASMDRHGVQRPATTNREARDQASAARSANAAGPRSQNAGQAAQQRRQNTAQTQTGARTRATAGPSSIRNNAFAGARSPAQTAAQANRGRASQVSAQRASTPRAAGRPVSRPASAPARGARGRR